MGNPGTSLETLIGGTISKHVSMAFRRPGPSPAERQIVVSSANRHAKRAASYQISQPESPEETKILLQRATTARLTGSQIGSQMWNDLIAYCAVILI